jgi:GNAT superfamily N-acetyltransferase
MNAWPPPFVVFALPRSRSYWVSRFLNYGGWSCGHDEVRHARSLDDIRSWLAMPLSGTVETAAAPFWRLLVSDRPDVRIAVIRRPVDEAVASMLALGLDFDTQRLTTVMRNLDHKLGQIAARCPDVLSLTYAELKTEEACARLFEHCLPFRHDPAWWRDVSALNLQIDMAALLRYYAAHAHQLEKLAKTVKHRIISTLLPFGLPRSDAEFDGMTFQVEPGRDFYRDAQALFAEHLVQTGQAPDDHARKNLPLLFRLDDLGMLQCLTARSNGRMFGYLQSIIAPSLDDPNVLQAEHTIFFASPAIRGLGMRLQRAALTMLRKRGVQHVIMRAGHRGSGPRLGTFYRRLGAEEFGQLYRLELEAA